MLTLDLWGIGIWLFAPRARVTMGALDRNGHFERHDDMESLATATACQCHQSNHSCLHDFSVACFWTGKGLSFNTYPATDFLFAQQETYLPPLSRNGPNPLISTIKCTKCFNLPETWESPNWCTDRMTILAWWSCTTPSHKVTTLAPTCRGCRKNWPPKSKLLKSCYLDCGWKYLNNPQIPLIPTLSFGDHDGTLTETAASSVGRQHNCGQGLGRSDLSGVRANFRSTICLQHRKDTSHGVRVSKSWGWESHPSTRIL